MLSCYAQPAPGAYDSHSQQVGFALKPRLSASEKQHLFGGEDVFNAIVLTLTAHLCSVMTCESAFITQQALWLCPCCKQCLLPDSQDFVPVQGYCADVETDTVKSSPAEDPIGDYRHSASVFTYFHCASLHQLNRKLFQFSSQCCRLRQPGNYLTDRKHMTYLSS